MIRFTNLISIIKNEMDKRKQLVQIYQFMIKLYFLKYIFFVHM